VNSAGPRNFPRIRVSSLILFVPTHQGAGLDSRFTVETIDSSLHDRKVRLGRRALLINECPKREHKNLKLWLLNRTVRHLLDLG